MHKTNGNGEHIAKTLKKGDMNNDIDLGDLVRLKVSEIIVQLLDH